jgi:phage portal protein BeeE
VPKFREAVARYLNLPAWDGWGGQGPASGASVLTTSYGQNGNEAIIPSLISNNVTAFACNSVVFGATVARVMLFSEANFAIQDMETHKLSGQFVTDGRKSTSLDILENPWPDGTTGELLARMMLDVDIAGNAYIWNTGTQLVRLRPEWVTIISELVPDALGRYFRRVIGYYYDPPEPYRDQAGPPALFTEDEVAHWAPIPDPVALWRGMSWMTPIIREVAADNGMTEYKIKYLQNAASPNLLIKYTQKIGQTVVNRIRDRINDDHGGVDNAFRTLILDEGADVTVIGNTLEQMNFSTVQAAGENRIVIASGVPGIVIGSKEGLMAATYSNYQQAMRRFADLTMRPLWRSACACLAKFVNVPTGSRLWFNASDIAALRQGEKEQADTTLVLATAAAALVREGYEPESVTEAVMSGDLSLLKWIEPDVPEPPTKLDPDLLLANPALAPHPPGVLPPGSPGATPAPALNGSARKPPNQLAVSGVSK